MKISRNNFLILASALLVLGLSAYLVQILQEKRTILREQSMNRTDCPGSEGQLRCWQRNIKQTLKARGLPAAFDVIAGLYATEPGFAGLCHNFTHELGESAYEMFAAHQSFELSSKTSYCGYGFYHGFMETLLQNTNDLNQAEEFCAYTDKQLAAYTKKAIVACYHGIGHGAVDGTNLSAWGNQQALIDPALDICSAVSKQPVQIYQCGTGVFNALAIALNSNLYDLKPSGDPYSICANQNENFKKACYEQMNTQAESLAGGDFGKAAAFALKIKDPDDAKTAMENLAPTAVATKIHLVDRDYTDEIAICKTMKPDLKTVCISGLVGGILEFGKPDYEYVEAISLCQSAMFSDAEREDCYARLISSLGVLYSAQKSKQICGTIQADVKKFCSVYE